jgi:hypothetical protein
MWQDELAGFRIQAPYDADQCMVRSDGRFLSKDVVSADSGWVSKLACSAECYRCHRLGQNAPHLAPSCNLCTLQFLILIHNFFSNLEGTACVLYCNKGVSPSDLVTTPEVSTIFAQGPCKAPHNELPPGIPSERPFEKL